MVAAELEEEDTIVADLAARTCLNSDDSFVEPEATAERCRVLSANLATATVGAIARVTGL